MAKIKGLWVFNETPDYQSYVPHVPVNFTSDGTDYIGMTNQCCPIDYVLDWGGTPVSAFTSAYWTNENLRTVDFGESEQEVPDEFYEWFTANAVTQEEPELESVTYSIRSETLEGIANAIREKLNTSDRYTPTEMPQAIIAIESEGGDDNGSYDEGYADGESAGYEKGHREGYDSGYEDGHEDGLQEGLELGDSNGSYVNGYNDGYAQGYVEGEMDGYEEGVVEGQQAEHDTFWDTYQSNGNRANHMRAFAESYWKDAIFKPKYPIVCKATQSYHTSNATSVFQSSDVTHIDVPITIDGSAIGGIKANSFFTDADQLETIFLITFIGVNGFPNTFLNCKKLKDITVGGSIEASISFADCPLLTDESGQSITDHLADLTGKTAQTITWHKDMEAKLTGAQKATITAKNWIAVYK